MDPGNHSDVKNIVREVTCNNEVGEGDPVIDKLALYTLAHKNYLETLNWHLVSGYKVNWGLWKQLKLSE